MAQSDIKGEFIPGETRIKYGGHQLDVVEREAIDKVLDRSWWTIDEEGRLLEQEIAKYVYPEYHTTLRSPVTLTNSGSSALMVAFATLIEAGRLKKGDSVITGGVQFPTTISSLFYNGLVPTYVDVDPGNLCVDPDKIEGHISSNTKAILAVAIAGNIPDIAKLVDLANRYDLLLILDNCDGFGGTWNGDPIEQYFDITATSFHAAHIMSMGEGGAIITDDEELGEIAHSMREWGRYGDTDKIPSDPGIPGDYPGRYVFKHMGFNMKPLELQCAVGREQLKKLQEIKAARANNFSSLYAGLMDLQSKGFISLPVPQGYAEPSWFGFPILAKNRPELRIFLEERQIETRTIFGGNITRQPAFKNFGHKTDLTVSDRVMEEGMFVSVHPSVNLDMIKYIVDSFHEFYEPKN